MLNLLQTVSSDPRRLEEFLSTNLQEVYDYFNDEKYSTILISRNEIHKYISLHITVFRELDTHSKDNLAFIALLLEVSERLCLWNTFKALYEHLCRQEFAIAKRLEATALYLIGINTADDYLSRFDSICEILQDAYETEEDDERKVLASIINFYGQYVHNWPFLSNTVKDLQERFRQKRTSEPHLFLNHPIIDDLLLIPTSPHTEAYSEIHKLLDAYLGRSINRVYSTDPLLIEEATKYEHLLKKAKSDFSSIRQISAALYNNDDRVFHSLLRGVKVIENDNQLLAYMYSYGKMHHQKLISGFKFLPEDFFRQPVRIVDWGCGQALATVSYFDFINSNSIEQDVRHITLIEPSELAIKRGALHTCHCCGGNNVLTTHKDIDSIKEEDLQNSISTSKLHLLSNIVDVELFSLHHLLNLIQTKFKGENYFVCVSPFVNDLKTKRIDMFTEFFSKLPEFQMYGSESNRSGEWINSWTRVVRVFRARI